MDRKKEEQECLFSDYVQVGLTMVNSDTDDAGLTPTAPILLSVPPAV